MRETSSLIRWQAALALGAVLAGCAANPNSPATSRGVGAPVPAVPVAPSAPDMATAPIPEPETGASVASTDADERVAFSTRYAHFLPASWSALPGWREDRLADAWAAFRRSCAALGSKSGWDGPCARAASVGNADDQAIRQFFEREFALYEIRNADRTPEGTITGYYEPMINGSRSQGGAYLYPVYGMPDDLLLLDVRKLPKDLRGKPVPARIEGRSVIPLPGGNAPYIIDVGDLQADVRDKKLRVRLDGKRVVPYATRAEIERNGLPRARVLVWVDNPAAFYSMQIQGSGKVRLADGRVVRLAYAEQNGHPFKPPVSNGAGAPKKNRVTTRGLSIDLPEGEDDPVDESDAPPAEPLTRGLKAASARPDQPAAAPRPSEPLSADVERLVEELARARPSAGRPSVPAKAASPASRPPNAPEKPSPAANRPASQPASAPAKGESVAAAPRPNSFPQPSAEVVAAISADPSYVFFREIPDGPEGPIGALGVPLTAGRSVAVDPRTTPLGFPVFVSTSQPGRRGQLNRLMMAQDTGGAIRGAVRADYFWGFGADAYSQAARMKESGRMWLMLPHGQQVAARDQALRTRGLGGAASSLDCVIADPDLCVEDR